MISSRDGKILLYAVEGAEEKLRLQVKPMIASHELRAPSKALSLKSCISSRSSRGRTGGSGHREVLARGGSVAAAKDVDSSPQATPDELSPSLSDRDLVELTTPQAARMDARVELKTRQIRRAASSASVRLTTPSAPNSRQPRRRRSSTGLFGYHETGTVTTLHFNRL